MKKIISILAILVLILSLSACKRAPKTEDEEVILDKEEEVPKTEEPKTEETEQGENNQTDEPEVQEPTEDTTDDTTEESLQTEQQAHDPALDRVFSPYEVIVVLAEEETAKKLTYTPADFPEVDSYYVQDVTGYFFATNPEYRELTALTILLNEATKQNVLESIKILEQDERIHAAHTNSAPIINQIHFRFKDGILHDYSINDFPNIDLEEIFTGFDSGNIPYGRMVIVNKPGGTTDYNRYENIYNALKEVVNNVALEPYGVRYYNRTKYACMSNRTVGVELNEEYAEKIDQFTIEDFPQVKLASVHFDSCIFTQYGEETGLRIELAEPSYENLYEYIALLEQDERVKCAHTLSNSVAIHD